jgi:hypothetical protein
MGASAPFFTMGKLNTVKIPLMAESIEEIVLKQIENNLLNNVQYHYSDPVPYKEGWLCWYFADITKHREL